MRYTVCEDGLKSGALVFETGDVAVVEKIEELSKIFPSGYCIRPAGNRQPRRYFMGKTQDVAPEVWSKILVASGPTYDQIIPDKAPLDTPNTEFFYQNKKYSVNLRQRYNECLSLFKAVGCESCPDKGLKCLGESVGLVAPDKFYQKFDSEDLMLRMLKEYKTLGGFELVEPSATASKEFQSTYRPYWQHDFRLIEENAKDRSDRAYKAAVSRAFKKDQCSKCIISKTCESYRHCKGAFPVKDVIIKQCEEEFAAALKNSPWPEWQLWEIARKMGDTAKHSRWNIFLAGWDLLRSDIITPVVRRAKLNITEYGGLKAYKDIADAFNLALTEEDAQKPGHGPVKDPEIRATLWLALNTRHGYQNYGWGCRRHIGGIGATDSGVTIQWTNGKYLQHCDELRTVEQIAKEVTYGRLAHIKKIEVRP